MIDRVEATRRGQSSQRKPSTKHPYAALEHRVIDSPAYRALTYSARSLLTMLTRQLTKDNNGHLQATFKYLKEYGFDSERTIGRGIKELIAHGFVCRTRLGGYQQGPSLYAVTWLSITRKENVFLNGFVSCAWRDWNPADKKTPPAKIPSITGKNVVLSLSPQDKNAADRQDKNADYELIPHREIVATSEAAVNPTRTEGESIAA